jgi:hypothetical protein
MHHKEFLRAVSSGFDPYGNVYMHYTYMYFEMGACSFTLMLQIIFASAGALLFDLAPSLARYGNLSARGVLALVHERTFEVGFGAGAIVFADFWAILGKAPWQIAENFYGARRLEGQVITVCCLVIQERFGIVLTNILWSSSRTECWVYSRKFGRRCSWTECGACSWAFGRR